jgi:F0F1-type ATP synthase assembly protein I
VFDSRTRQDLNRGFSEAFGRGIDLALTPVVFGLIGWLIDRVAGTSPIFTFVVAGIGILGTVVKIKLGYDKDMAAFDDTAATRPRAVAPAPLKMPPLKLREGSRKVLGR